MKPPKLIYLVQPYPDTADYDWCEDPALGAGMKKEDSILYVRADYVLETLNEYKKVTDLINQLNEVEWEDIKTENITDVEKITEHYQEVYRLHKTKKCSVYSECIFCDVDRECCPECKTYHDQNMYCRKCGNTKAKENNCDRCSCEEALSTALPRALSKMRVDYQWSSSAHGYKKI